MKTLLTQVLEDWCTARKGRVTPVAGAWVTRVDLPQGHFFVHGYALPLNSAASFQLARDKVATSTVLMEAGVACIPHRLVMRPEVAQAWYGYPCSVEKQLEECRRQFGEDMVIKPNHGFGGQGVERVHGQVEALSRTLDILAVDRDCAVSPFVDAARELRLVVLDGRVVCVYEKERGEDWRHNLARGARAVPLEDSALRDRATQRAREACEVLGLRLASVDVFVTGEDLRVIEVNSGVVLEKMAHQLPGGVDIARRVYGEILGAVERDLDRLHGTI